VPAGGVNENGRSRSDGRTDPRAAALAAPCRSPSLTVPRSGAYDDFSRLPGQVPIATTLAHAPRARVEMKPLPEGAPTPAAGSPVTSRAASDAPCRPAQPSPQHADERSLRWPDGFPANRTRASPPKRRPRCSETARPR